ncbi:PREDICTED: uncharacterized protein LOC106744639 [Dinoponera quadriceps]|uniref:Uncharacterized protein LOC106744639 n=1 Tax=Dinoponera quadriceps TaxID=609295 RepID=A0A6P3X9V0_DINQU|nr:PREDICTED: uncharacterized protein LOC106744639 [Dinoponera quadriceps]
MEETGEAPKMASLRQTTTSLLLARWMSAKRSRQNESQDEDNARYTPPSSIPAMEDYSINISELGYCTEIDRSSLRINEDFIRNVLAEHARQIGCRGQLCEDLEKLGTTGNEAFFAACKPNEINVLLLYASFIGRVDLIRRLCVEGNVDYAEPEQGLTALHLCAFRNCLDGVQCLIAHGANIYDISQKHTPFHYAAFGDSYEVAQYFVQRGLSQKSSEDEETVLHVAARTNALRVLSLLAPNNEDLERLDSDGFAAIHYAADAGNSDCLCVLLKAGCPVDLPTGKNDTALHLSAGAGCVNSVVRLVEAKASLKLKNHRGYTAMHLAARSHSLECVEVLLRGGADPNVEDDEGRSPLHLALSRSLMTDDIVELLLFWKANVNKADKYGYTPLHIAASNELSRCVDLLIRHEADLTARTNGGTSALSIVLRKIPTCMDAFERRLDASVSLHRQGFMAGELQLRLDFRPLLQHRRHSEIGYLHTFVKEGYKEILEHPLCQSFLHLKWQKIRKYYAVRLLFFLVYILILTFWVMTGLAYNCYNELHERPTRPPCDFFHPAVLEIQWCTLVVLTLLELFRKFTVLPSYRSVRQFFTQADNLLDWCLISSVFAIFAYAGKTHVWQNYIGAFAVLCGWSNLMLMIGQLPMFGAYVAMFTSVQAQVIKLLMAYACLLVGFTASFCVIFPHSKAFGSSPHMAFIKVLVMMTGELGFEDLFFSSSNKTAQTTVLTEGTPPWLLQFSAQLSFVLFLLFVTIVLMNLLIGIAVHDIKGLQKTAGLAKLVRQTKLICDVEVALIFALLPKRLIKCLRWSALVLPSPLCAFLTVRPLNPRETRLPRDILSAVYKIAKEEDGPNHFAVLRKKTHRPGFAKASLKGDPVSCRRRDTSVQDCNRLEDDIAELRRICEKNQALLRELAKMQINNTSERNYRDKSRRTSRKMQQDERKLRNAGGAKAEMDLLEIPIINEGRQHTYSTGSLNERHEPLAVRLASTYRSLRCTHDAEDDANGAGSDRIDAGEPPPADESLFFDNLECCKQPYVNGAKLRSAIWSIVSPAETRLLLYMEKCDALPDACKGLRNVAYIWASYRGLPHLLPQLERAGARYDYVEPRSGMNAILAASLGDKVACVEYLIGKGADVNYENPISRYTALHVAALGNSWHAAATLLEHGAKLNYSGQEMVEPVLHSAVRAKAVETVKVLLERGASVVEKNHLGQTPLHVACFVQSIPCVELLSAGAADAVDREHRTPLHFAVMSTDSSVELVQLLLKRGALANAADKSGFTPLHIAALNEQSRCVDALIWAGADISATTCAGLSALNVILRKIPESLHVFRQRLDASIRLTRPVSHNREFEMKLHFDILFPSNNQCETSFINTFVQEHRKDLLSHPLVMAFLHLKWEKIRKLYLLRIFLYAMTVICMTTYVLTALAYKCYNHESNNSKICSGKRISFLFRRPIIEIEWYLALVLTCITIPRKVIGFISVHKSAIQYFSNIDNVLDGVVIVSIFVTSFIYTGRTYDWQNYVGAFAILCAWTNLMLMVGQLPAFGTYVAMFTHIQFEFAKLLLAYSGLLIGFTVSFCVIFSGEPAFGNPFTGLIKVLAMMAGELDFEGLINQSDDEPTTGSFVIYHPLSVCSQILFTLFIVFVTVILMNLLVGIAVHDIQGLRNHAGLTKLVRQTKLILFTEMILHNATIPYTFRKWMSDHKIDVENRKRVLVVKPLNPLEKRLPKDILKAAYEIAQKNIPFDDVSLSDHAAWLKRQEPSDVHTAIEKLITMVKVNEEAVKLLKVELMEMNKMLKTVIATLTRGERHT